MTETREQAVERLKVNEKPYTVYDDMQERDREILSQLKDECEFLEEFPVRIYWRKKTGNSFCLLGIYRIRPNYQPGPPKPEYEDCKVLSQGGQLKYISPTWKEEFIGNAVDDENFRGFWIKYPDGSQLDINVTHVSRKMMVDKVLVVARFERK